MTLKAHLFYLLLSIWITSAFGAYPTGCSYDSGYSATGVYTCVFGGYTEPLTYSTFSSPYPQRLKITSLTGSFPAGGSAFSGFSSFTSANFDANYPASLELECTTSGTLTLSTSTFTDMGYLQEVKFSYCNIVSLAANMLSNFGSLNSLVFQQGSIATYSTDFLTGLTIERLSVPEPKGELVFKDSTISPTALPMGVFDSQTSMKVLKLENAGVTSIDKVVFGVTRNLHYLSLADNPLTTLDNDMFSYLVGLDTINLEGVPYACSCSNLKLLTFEFLPSGLVCNTPTAYQNKRAISYYSANCVTTDTCTDIAIGSTCMTIYEVVGFVMVVVALIIGSVALAIICHSRRQLMTGKSSMKQKRNGSWGRVRDAMNKNDFSDKKPPMKGADSVQNSGWM